MTSAGLALSYDNLLKVRMLNTIILFSSGILLLYCFVSRVVNVLVT